MEVIAWTVALFVGIFRWLFMTLGGKRVASIVSLLLLPLTASRLFAEPGTSKGAVPLMLGAIALAVVSVFAMWRTRFFNMPLSACDPLTNIAAWVSIAAGYILIALFFISLAFLAFIMAAVSAAFKSFLGL